jgi:hypothetical protein
MPSKEPKDFGRSVVRRTFCSPAQRAHFNLGQFTANGTDVADGVQMTFDRETVIREIWVSCSDIPSDPDGTMLLNAIVYDLSETADDTIVSSQDLESLCVAADVAYQCTLATEDTENQNTVQSGDTLRFTLVNNSVAITTNPFVNVTVVYQVLEDVVA